MGGHNKPCKHIKRWGRRKEGRKCSKLKYDQYLHYHFMAAIDYVFTFSFALNLNLRHCFDFSCDIKEVLLKYYQVT